MLHKLLTAGPSAFNLTSILSQAAQLSNQGRFLALGTPWGFLFCLFSSLLNCVSYLFCFTSNSPTIQPVAHVVNIGRLVAQVLRFSKDQHAADQRRAPETATQHAVCHLTAQSEALLRKKSFLAR